MLVLNEVSYTGEVFDVQKSEKGLYIDVFQKVCGKIDTTIKVFAPAMAFKNELSVSKGDTVYIGNAVMYQSDESLIFRITKPEQIQILAKNLDLGEKAAEDEFF